MSATPTTAHLRRSLSRLRRCSATDLVFAGIPESSTLRLLEFDGAVVGPLRGARLNAGHGLGGRVLEQRRTIGVHDYLSAPTILHTYDSIIRAESLRTLVASPVVVGRQVVAVLYSASRTPQQELGRLYDSVSAEARSLEQTLAVESALSIWTSTPWQDESAQLRRSLQRGFLDLHELADSVACDDIRARIRKTANGLAFPPTMRTQPARHLTRREQEVLALLAGGHANSAIAELLGIGVHTVKDHVKNLMAKFAAKSRHQVVVAARLEGLLP